MRVHGKTLDILIDKMDCLKSMTLVHNFTVHRVCASQVCFFRGSIAVVSRPDVAFQQT